MNLELILHFEGGYLRPLEVEDIHEKYISGLNDPEVNRYLQVRHENQSEETVARFIQSNQQSSDAVLFGIWLRDQDHHCGTLRLHGIDVTKRSAHIGICVFDKMAWGKQLGTKAIATATKWAFEGLGLNCVEAGAYLENVASQRAFMKAGYLWAQNIEGKFNLHDKPTTVKVYIAQKDFD
jgi:[ribosomal protein S5]-alanine N-acetyltransferase